MQENQAPSFPDLIEQVSQTLDLHQDYKTPVLPTFQTAVEPTKDELEELEKDLKKDLDDLDSLLAESLAIKQKKPCRLMYERCRDSSIPTPIVWKVEAVVAVWHRNKCACGHHTCLLFTHYMIKKTNKAGGAIHWEKTSILPEGMTPRHALKTIPVPACEQCMPAIDINTMEDIENAFK